MENKKLEFQQFIKKHFPDYIIDEKNHSVIILLGQWANRNTDFENPAEGRYLDKGLFLSGTIGTGKTELMRMLNYYLKYLSSLYAYNRSIVWKFAEAFKSKGHECFIGHEIYNRYYDELALTDDKTGFPIIENVNNYGDKILIGERLIMMRYNSFKERGFQSHFSTNCPPTKIREIYGDRAFSRLTEMCNFIALTGDDRRATIRPTFHTNANNPAPPKRDGITEDEVLEFKVKANSKFKYYCDTGVTPENSHFDYVSLSFYGCQIAKDDELKSLMDIAAIERRKEIQDTPVNISDEKRFRDLRKQYESGNLDDKERAYLFSIAKKNAVMLFYEKMKLENKKVIFEL